jgi:hypothetical protein
MDHVGIMAIDPNFRWGERVRGDQVAHEDTRL